MGPLTAQPWLEEQEERTKWLHLLPTPVEILPANNFRRRRILETIRMNHGQILQVQEVVRPLRVSVRTAPSRF